MSRPYFSPSSRQDLLDVLNYIAKDKPGAARKFVEKLEESCWTIARNPDIGTRRDDLLPGLRSWSIGNYVVFFRKVSTGADIVRVVHGARDTGNMFD